MTFETLSDACFFWVNEMNFIPMSVIEKLIQINPFDMEEVTPPAKGDRVAITSGEYNTMEGEIVDTHCDGEDDLYLIDIDNVEEEQKISSSDFYVIREDQLPMWGTMFAFKDDIDNAWLEGRFGDDGLQLMADCGFRIYKQEDYGYIFGLDGAGYSFYEAHWQPLYKARGLHWHRYDDTVKESKHA